MHPDRRARILFLATGRTKQRPGPMSALERRVGGLPDASADVLAGAGATHPERFVRDRPVPRPVPTGIRINPSRKEVPRS
jgi:hypothetical protein